MAKEARRSAGSHGDDVIYELACKTTGTITYCKVLVGRCERVLRQRSQKEGREITFADAARILQLRGRP